VKSILHSAENAALLRERYTMARFAADAADVEQIVRELRRIDRQFKIVIQPSNEYTDLIVQW
jgi:hypothetical protein